MLRWVGSDKGRIAAAIGAIVISSLAGNVKYSLNTVFLDRYREVWQMYRSGFEVPVAQEVMNLAGKVMQDCKIEEHDLAKTTMFTVFGFETFGAGSIQFRSGARIGIPHHFGYKTADDVEVAEIKIGKESRCLNPKTSLGKQLINSLVLSEDAKRFAIAHEVHSCNTLRLYFSSTVSCFSLFTSYLLAASLNLRYNLRQKVPLGIRLCAYSICGAMAIALAVVATDALNVYYDMGADDAAAGISIDYARGGVEYYEKLIDRSKALREILGEEGAKYYTPGGNLNSLIRVATIPATTRLDRLTNKLKEYERAAAEKMLAENVNV